MKRKLIRTIGSDVSVFKLIPQQYMRSKQHWLCAVCVEHGDGVLDEYEIQPDQKIYLEDFLDIVAAEIDQLEDPSETEGANNSRWQADIFLLKRGK